MQLNGKSEPRQRAYARAVRMLIEFSAKEPDFITEEELKHYFLHRKNVDRWAPNTMRICYGGIRFFYRHVIERDWHILGILRAQVEHRLPAVLSREEVFDRSFVDFFECELQLIDNTGAIMSMVVRPHGG